jgi:hypothetical protein
MLFCLLAIAGTVAPARGGEPFRYPEGIHGKGELKYVHGIPVLSVEGTPKEIGEQVGVLCKPAARLLNFPREALEHLATPAGAKALWPVVVKRCTMLLDNFPADYRAELEAMVKSGGVDHELAVVGNTAFDLKADLGALFGCSALVVEAERSVTGQPIFGRNMDYLSLGYLHQYSLVTVYRPTGKHAFASVGYPGMVGCLSGINDAGLALTILETTGARPGEGPVFNPRGIPFALCYRKLLEECTTVDEAATLLRQLKRTTTNNLTLCDRSGSAVFEVTPTRVVVRRARKGINTCTNHFCSEELKLTKPKNAYATLDRLATLDKARELEKKLGVEDVHRYLDAVNQGNLTLQTMIFQPASLTLHVAFAVGEQPSSSRILARLELAPLLKHEQAGK